MFAKRLGQGTMHGAKRGHLEARGRSVEQSVEGVVRGAAQVPQDSVLLAPVGTDHAVELGIGAKSRDQLRDVLRPVLEVVVEGDDDVPARMLETADRRAELSHVREEVEAQHVRMAPAERLDHLPGFVRRGIVHQQDLEGGAERSQRLPDAIGQGFQPGARGVAGNDDGVGGRARQIRDRPHTKLSTASITRSCSGSWSSKKHGRRTSRSLNSSVTGSWPAR